MIIVDTTVWVDLNGVATPETDWLEEHLSRQPLGLLDLMVCEILQGLPPMRKPPVFCAIATFPAFRNRRSSSSLWPPPGTTALLRAQGRTVRKTVDCLIATFCLREGHTLLHCDRDFFLSSRCSA